MTDSKGTYIEYDGRPAVRFERNYPYSADRVWRAVTDPGELAHWFPSPGVSYEQRVGSPITLKGDPRIEQANGKVLAWEPPRHFAFEWGDDELHFTVDKTPTGARFELINVLSGSGAAARNAAGWDVCLAELDKTVADQPGDGPNSATSLAWQPLYDGYVAAGLPAGAEVPH
ncbi:MAG: hypothetical protein JWR35_951 [Marmoricola sp.]|nr:hypothetical protein [Marmoricola sp.]